MLGFCPPLLPLGLAYLPRGGGDSWGGAFLMREMRLSCKYKEKTEVLSAPLRLAPFLYLPLWLIAPCQNKLPALSLVTSLPCAISPLRNCLHYLPPRIAPPAPISIQYCPPAPICSHPTKITPSACLSLFPPELPLICLPSPQNCPYLPPIP